MHSFERVQYSEEPQILHNSLCLIGFGRMMANFISTFIRIAGPIFRISKTSQNISLEIREI